MKRDRLFIVQMTGNKRTKFTFDHDGSVIWKPIARKKAQELFPPESRTNVFYGAQTLYRPARTPGPALTGPHVRLPAGTDRQKPAPTHPGAPDAQRATKSASLRLCCVGALTLRTPGPASSRPTSRVQSATCAVHCMVRDRLQNAQWGGRPI